MKRGLSNVFRLGAWTCVVLLALLSWLPAEDIVRTGINGRIEHFIAYMGTTLFVGAAYALRRGSLRIMAMLISYAGFSNWVRISLPDDTAQCLILLRARSGSLLAPSLFRSVTRCCVTRQLDESCDGLTYHSAKPSSGKSG
jgi:hypothetical protein